MPAELIERVVFRAPATVADIRDDFAQDEIRFLFIDANHRHPWPTLDLLGALDYLAPGATVVLHDINLPVIHPEYSDWGAKHLFDSLAVEKEAAQDGEDNIGAIRIPGERDALRESC